MPSFSNLVKKTDYNTKITEIENKLNNHNHGKYISTPEFNTLTADVFNATLAQANLITKTDFNAKLSSCFIGKRHFEENGMQNYLVFQPIHKYFKVIANTDYVSSWKSNGLSAETVKPPTTSDNSPTPAVSYYGTKTRVTFVGSCLKQLKI